MQCGEEYKLQQGCVKWFRLQYPQYLLWSTPNEACWKNKNYFEQIGLMAGVADLICVLPNKVLFIEMKAKKGRQSLEQKQFQQRIETLGFEYCVVRDFETFMNLINNNIQKQ